MRSQLFVLACLSCCAVAVSAQEVSLSEGAPRFLLAMSSPARTTIEINPAKAAIFQRRVTLSLEHTTVSRALAAVGRQAGIRMVYSRDVLDPDAPTRIKAEGITVAAALTEILLGAGVDVVLSDGDRITLTPRKLLAGPPAPGVIVGRVTDAKTQTALAGATVVVQGTSRSATTGSDGRYRIAAVAPGTYTVRARYIGYAPGAASVTVSMDQEATADFTLEKSAQRLDEVVTTGTVIPTEVKAIPTPISVITGEQIQEQHIQRVDQLFRGDIPGIFSWDNGSGNYTSAINVRGTTSLDAAGGSIKTYVDGVEVTDQHFIATIDPNSIERVEVLRGPQASTIYGSDALNGVLQIFTKTGTPGTKPQLDAQLSAGALQTQWNGTRAVDQQDYSASLVGGGPQFSYSVGGARIHTGEWLKEYSNTGNSAYAGVRGTSGAFTAAITGHFYHLLQGQPRLPVYDPFGGAPFYVYPVNQDMTVETATVGATLGYRVSPRWTHTLVLGYDRLGQEEFGRPKLHTPADTMSTGFTDQGSKASVRYNTTFTLPLGRSVLAAVTAGADYYEKREEFALLTAGTFTGTFDGSNFLYGTRTDFHNAGYFSQVNLSLGEHWFATAGLRAEDNANFGQDFGLAWAPRVGLAHVATLGSVTLKARGSYGKAIRPPAQGTRDGSASSFSIYLPNPALGPEIQRGWDAGLDLYYGNTFALKATYYRQQAEGLIDVVLVDAGAKPPVFQYQNIGQVHNRGWELEASASPGGGLAVTGTYSATSSTVATLSPSYGGALQVGDQITGVPRHTAGATVSYRLGRASASVGVTHVGAWTNIEYNAYFAYIFGLQPYRGSDRSYWITYPAFEKYRFHLTYDISAHVTSFLSVDNLTNSYAFEKYDFSVPPGRATMAGVRLRL